MAEELLDACWEGDFRRAEILAGAGWAEEGEGDFVGVKDVRDWLGRTPLHLACRSGQLDFVRLLIQRHNCNPQCKTNDGATPLHEACIHGRFELVKLLIETFQCNPGISDNFGWTPLHMAVDSDHPNLEIVRYLIVNCSCDPKGADEDGLTSLHHACGCYSDVCDGDAVEECLKVVKFLVKDCKCDPNDPTSEGMNPLLFACRAGLLNVVRFLILEKDCDVAVSDSKGNGPLHFACQSGNLETVRFLITEQNCDPNDENSDGQPPLKFAEEPPIIRELIRYGAKPERVYETYGQVLGALSNQQPLEPPIKVFITGNPEVGKSTLVRSLQAETTGLLGRFQKVEGVDERTAGIIPYDFDSRKYGRVTLYDFAGQREFYHSHAAVLQTAIQSSPPIFLIVIDLREDGDKLKENVLYWLSFLENQCISVSNKPHVIVVGSHADMLVQNEEDVRPKINLVSSLQNENVFSCIEFSGVVAIDCQYPESPGMTELRQFLKNGCDALRTTAAINFNCHCFLVYLLDRFRDIPAETLNRINAKIKIELADEETQDALVSFVPESLAALCSLCDELNDRGHILFLKNLAVLEDSWVIIDKAALLSEVTGTIFAPEEFKQHCDLATSTGVVPMSKIAATFSHHDPNMLVSFLSHLEFCHVISDEEILQLISEEYQSKALEASDRSSREYTAQSLDSDSQTQPHAEERYFFFPALVRIKETDRNIWESKPEFAFRSAWLLQCTQPGQFLMSRFIQVLLLRLAFCFALAQEEHEVHRELPTLQRKCQIWKSGINWGNRYGVQTLVKVVEQNRAVVLLMQCSDLQAECFQLRSAVLQKIRSTAAEFCPRVQMVESFLDPSEATYPLRPCSDLKRYSIHEIAQSIVRNSTSVVSKYGWTVPLRKLLCYEPYAGLARVLQKLFNNEDPSYNTAVVSVHLLSDIADCIPDAEKRNMLEKVIKPHPTRLQESIKRAPEGVTHEIICILQIWRDGCSGTCQCLREKLDEFSIFAGKDLMELARTN